MSASAELAHRDDTGTVSLFVGATPEEMRAAATEVANVFSDIVKRQRLYKRIGDRDHVLIEGWQTVGTLVGVYAIEAGGVRQLDWPEIGPLRDEPPAPGPEPDKRRHRDRWEEWKQVDDVHARWRHHATLLDARAIGGAFGFAAAFTAVKDGRPLGWAEGRVTRSERTWAGRDDYAIASMAQTRGQSRALAAPLKFIVKLAGYEGTPAEEMDSAAPAAAGDDGAAVDQRVAELEHVIGVLRARQIEFADDDSYRAAAEAAQAIYPAMDAWGLMEQLVRAYKFEDGLPEIVARAFRIFHWWAGLAEAGAERAMAPAARPAPRKGPQAPASNTRAAGPREPSASTEPSEPEPENAPPADPRRSAYHTPPTEPDDGEAPA